ncbi:hypothetical protein MHM582_1164 [Microbacterium sp. HM58-2]|nr:hypothetical protein MHM582_1164 [Microbacterium sp. HM58-2]
MTPVATLIATTATTWDAALEETLSGTAGHPSATSADGSSGALHGAVHSVHARAANLRFGDLLVGVVSDELDDAPWTVRLPVAEWSQLALAEGVPAALRPGEIRIGAAADAVSILLPPERRWTPTGADPAALDVAQLVAAHGTLSLFHGAAPQTPFGRASAALLAHGVEGLRAAVTGALAASGSDAALAAAVSRLVGLGEGLTPSGDDVLTGLAFLAAQPGMVLNRIIPGLARAVDLNAERTTLLSATTIRAALAARGRQSMHDLVHALAAPDSAALHDAAGRILAIGHSSGADLLTGIRLALELEAAARISAATHSHDLEQSSRKKESIR